MRFGRPEIELDVERARKLRAKGLSWRAMAAEMNVPKDTLIRRLA